MVQISELAGKSDAQSAHQLARWVATKESHAEDIQKKVARYFLAQRIKSSAANYVDQLKTAHGVIVAAMKSKQTVDTKQADALKEAILALHKAYTAK